MLVGPTRYRDVVLTSWDRGYLIAVVSRDVNVVLNVVLKVVLNVMLTSWDRGRSDGECE